MMLASAQHSGDLPMELYSVKSSVILVHDRFQCELKAGSPFLRSVDCYFFRFI